MNALPECTAYWMGTVFPIGAGRSSAPPGRNKTMPGGKNEKGKERKGKGKKKRKKRKKTRYLHLNTWDKYPFDAWLVLSMIKLSLKKSRFLFVDDNLRIAPIFTNSMWKSKNFLPRCARLNTYISDNMPHKAVLWVFFQVFLGIVTSRHFLK